MNNNAKMAPMDMRERTLIFSRDIVKFLKSFPRDELNAPIRQQLIRSATSVGANFIEAKNGSSKRDFRSKVYICKKEASETMYWLELLGEFTDDKQLAYLRNECQEIIMILQKIITTVNHSSIH